MSLLFSFTVPLLLIMLLTLLLFITPFVYRVVVVATP